MILHFSWMFTVSISRPGQRETAQSLGCRMMPHSVASTTTKVGHSCELLVLANIQYPRTSHRRSAKLCCSAESFMYFGVLCTFVDRSIAFSYMFLGKPLRQIIACLFGYLCLSVSDKRMKRYWHAQEEKKYRLPALAPFKRLEVYHVIFRPQVPKHSKTATAETSQVSLRRT